MPTILTCIAGIAGGLTLSSCYDPYYTGRGALTVSDYEPGYVVRTLPPDYHSTVIDGTHYYHHDGVYYRPRGNSYVVVERPDVRRSRDYDRYDRVDRVDRVDRRAYRHDDYYDRRDVVERRVSRRDPDRDGIPNRYDSRPYRSDDVQIIRSLPSNYRVVDYRGDRYYIVEDRYYRTRGDVYIRVSPPF